MCREPPGSAISRNKEGMVQWLSGLADKEEVTCAVNQAVFYIELNHIYSTR